MSHGLLECTLTVGLILSGSVAAQNPAAQQTPAATQAAATQSQSRMVTVEGCVTPETDLRGTKFDDDDLDDFVLTSTKMIKGSAPPAGRSGAAAPMYEIDGIAAATLKKHAGRRVQIDGTFEDLDDDTVDIRGTSIRQMPGECPAK